MQKIVSSPIKPGRISQLHFFHWTSADPTEQDMTHLYIYNHFIHYLPLKTNASYFFLKSKQSTIVEKMALLKLKWFDSKRESLLHWFVSRKLQW